MNEIIILVFIVLAVYRLSLMIALEDGPFEIFKWYRELIIMALPENHWGVKGIHCPLCVGFWLSVLFAIPIYDGLIHYGLTVLAIAGAQTFMILIGGIPDVQDETPK